MKRQNFVNQFDDSMFLCGDPWSFAEDAKNTAGKTAFLNNKCNLCHSIESEKIEKDHRWISEIKRQKRSS